MPNKDRLNAGYWNIVTINQNPPSPSLKIGVLVRKNSEKRLRRARKISDGQKELSFTTGGHLKDCDDKLF